MIFGKIHSYFAGLGQNGPDYICYTVVNPAGERTPESAIFIKCVYFGGDFHFYEIG